MTASIETHYNDLEKRGLELRNELHNTAYRSAPGIMFLADCISSKMSNSAGVSVDIEQMEIQLYVYNSPDDNIDINSVHTAIYAGLCEFIQSSKSMLSPKSISFIDEAGDCTLPLLLNILSMPYEAPFNDTKLKTTKFIIKL